MTYFVLVLVFLGSTATAQFETEQLCIEAGNRAHREWHDMHYICVQSSLTKSLEGKS
jgi:hypothetical protein